MVSTERRGVLLFAHGASDPEWAMPFVALRERISEALPGVPVELAYLERMNPDFLSGIGRLVAAGAAQVTVVPLFLARGGHLRRDLPALMASCETRHPGIKLQQTPALGEAPELLDAISLWVVNQLPAGNS